MTTATSTTIGILTSDQKEFLDKPVGIPANLRLENLPEHVLRVLGKVRFVDAKDLLWLDNQVTEVRMDGELILKTRRTSGGQSVQLTRKKDEKRGPTTNVALNARRPTSKRVIKWSPDNVNDEVEAKIDAGVRYIAIVHRSKIGMVTISLMPECLANYGLAAIRLQRIWNPGDATEENPAILQVHHMHVLAPWLTVKWFNGEQKGLYARGNDLSISVNCGSGYIGIFKKACLAAHMWYSHSRKIGIMHASLARLANGRVALKTGPSAVGKSELGMLAIMLRQSETLEFTADDVSITVKIPGEAEARRVLIADDMVAFFIKDGRMYAIDLETGHYYRIDGYKKPGDIPLVDKLSAPGCTIPCTWSNVEFDETTQCVIPHRHVTIEGLETDNPRLVAETEVLVDGTYEMNDWEGNAVAVDIIIVGVPSAPGMGLPAFSQLHMSMAIALILAGLRANLGNQSIRPVGTDAWTHEGAGTLVPFSPMTDGEVAGDLLLLRQLSPGKTEFFFVSTRECVDLHQENKYDATWALRRCLESGVEFKKLGRKRHRSWYLGWIPEIPADVIDPRLLNPELRLGAERSQALADEFDSMVIDRLASACRDSGFPDEHRSYVSLLKLGKIQPDHPYQSMQLG